MHPTGIRRRISPVPGFIRMSFSILLVVAAVLCGLAALSEFAVRLIERAHPPQGRFVDVAGGRLHLLELGPADAPPGTDLAVTDDFVYPEPQAVSTGITINATAGTPFTAKVASFTDADPNGQVSDYSVVIDWGDGTSSAGGVTPNAAQPDSGIEPDQQAKVN